MPAPSHLENERAIVGSGNKNHGNSEKKTENFEILSFERIPFDVQLNDLVKPQVSDPLRLCLFLSPSCAFTVAHCLH